MKTKTKVISPLGTFEGDEIELTEKQINEVKDLFSDISRLTYLSLMTGRETIFFPADVIQKSIVILEVIA